MGVHHLLCISIRRSRLSSSHARHEYMCSAVLLYSLRLGEELGRVADKGAQPSERDFVSMCFSVPPVAP